MSRPTWSPAQYLQFADQRTRPCRDLAAQVRLERVDRIVDLGCGPGNSTRVLREQWPQADIVGIDSSPEMVEQARRDLPELGFLCANIEDWAESEAPPQFDLVFSNAALQWVRRHEEVLPRSFAKVKPGGALAMQLPAMSDIPAQRLIREMAAPRLTAPVHDWFTHDAAFYFDVLAPLAAHVDVWETEYLHVMNSADEIVEFYKGTALRPFLAAMESPEEFLAEYREAVRVAHPPRTNGKVLFPFRRIFVVAVHHIRDNGSL